MVNSSNKVANSVIWSGIERLSVQGIQFVLTIILARLVLPSDYGLIALLTVFLVMAQVFVDSGFTMALIQKQNPTEKDFSTAFYLDTINVFPFNVNFTISVFSKNFNMPEISLCRCMVPVKCKFCNSKF